MRRYIDAVWSRRPTDRGQPASPRSRPFEAYLRERVAAYPELTGQPAAPRAARSRLQRRLHHGQGLPARVRPGRAARFEVRFETPPGRQAQVDFAHFRTVFTDEPGVERVVWLFSLVLGHSRMLWGRFVPQQDMQTVLRCHAAAFEALGGAPAEILYDRMRTVVDREAPRGRPRPVTSSTTAPWSSSPATTATCPRPARPTGPRPRARSSGRSATSGRTSSSAAASATATTSTPVPPMARPGRQCAHPRHHAPGGQRALRRGAPRLQPLPAGPFQAVLRLERRITKDGMVSVDGNLYSVPDTTRRRPVEVHSTANEVRILEEGASSRCTP